MSGTPSAAALAALRPLHPPAPVGWWPPAPGWWLLLAIAVLLLLSFWWYRRRSLLRRAALGELRNLERNVTDNAQLAGAVNQLLRRFALTRFPQRQVASLSGEAWLAFLDAHSSAGGFVTGPGRVLVSAPYATHCTLDRAALLALARRWICRQRGGRA